MQVARLLLLPFSLIYSAILFLRNRLYDWGLLNSTRSKVPTIVVGNLALGGTGKTPFTDYLLAHLKPHFSTAALSRGYGRSTTGYLQVSTTSEVKAVGDEPLLLAYRHPKTQIAVCEDRVAGIEKMLSEKDRDIDVIVLDDAYQHRKLKGDVYVLLTTYHRPYFRDFVLPAGNLRDPRSERHRADIVVVTKCPPSLTPDERSVITRHLDVTKGTPVFFTHLEPVGYIEASTKQPAQTPESAVIVSSIADHAHFEAQIKRQVKVLNHLKFPDHHSFDSKDIQRIADNIDSFVKDRPVVITTEKDWMRLAQFQDNLKNIQVLYQPVNMNFLDDENKFQDHLIDLVRHARRV
ncbi:MAG: tetraacyldisaccharide 4'-kinase [Flavobacteriales bacterium]|nr:tetraacyldisaccharide 4'-kinase [Flavobacteriales bacterium]